MAQLAEPFASRIQCAFIGWPLELQSTLLDWLKRNNKAVLAADRSTLGNLATEFEDIVAGQLDARRTAKIDSKTDITNLMLYERVNNRGLNNQEIAGILRNWTVGEVGTIAASVGILAHFLACHPDIQQQLREKPELLWPANDEILRMHNPLVDSRRFTTKTVELSGRRIPAGQRITINWIAANRDPEVFPDPDKFSLVRDISKNLLYGIGIHGCPGRPLARMELVVIVQTLLQRSTQLQLVTGRPPAYARYPASGFTSLPMRIV
jgi:cytochrome P450